MRTHLIAFLLSITLAPTAVWAAYTDVFVFGDSLSDNGTAANFLGVDFPPPYSSEPAADSNRFSNGPVAVETMASRLGLPLNPSLIPTFPAAGTNYAVGGARAGRNDLGDLGSQVTAFQANHLGGAPSDALYVVFIGGNDVLEIRNETDDMRAADAITAATQAIELTLNTLIDEGAQSILVPNVVDIGLVPDAAGNRTRATHRSVEYNTALAATLAGVEANKSIDLFEYDLFALSQLIVGNPASFGLTNVTDPCTEGLPFPFFVGSCSAAVIDEYAFIDDIHPTATMHDVIGRELYATVIPVPAALPLLGSGLLVICVLARGRR